MVGMLQLAVDLLYEDDDNPTKNPSVESSSQSTSTIERGIELLSVHPLITQVLCQEALVDCISTAIDITTASADGKLNFI